jgi:hypothetical protein
MRLLLIRTAVILCGLTITSACNRNAAGPETQTTTGLQARNEPVSVNGCLRAGLAENTFVLTAEDTGTASETATYELSSQNVDLRQYVGERVQLSGTVRAEQQATSSGPDVVGKPKGTAGTPTIETTTQLNVKQMTVDTVKPSGERCAAEPPKEGQPGVRVK